MKTITAARQKRRQPWTRVVSSTALLLLSSVQCTVELPPEPLYGFDSCQDLESFLVDRAIRPQVARGPTVMGGGFLLGCASPAMDANLEAGAAPGNDFASENLTRESTTPTPVDPMDPNLPVDPNLPLDDERYFSTTNTQLDGVDEADYVKNDGDHIYILRRGRLIIVDAWPANSANILSDVAVGDHPFTMFVAGNRALVVGSTVPVRTGTLEGDRSGGNTILSLFELDDERRRPLLLRRLEIEGGYVSARRVGGEVVVISRSMLEWPEFEHAPFSDDVNRARIAEHGMERVLPAMHDQIFGLHAAPRSQPAVACENTWAPSESNAREILLVNTLNLNNELAPVGTAAVVADWSIIFSTEQSLYLASQQAHDGGYFGQAYAKTRIHKLSVFGGEKAAQYIATGAVEGGVKDQFSFSETGKVLHVVVTAPETVGAFETTQSSSLVALEEQGADLVEVGRADDIGREEFVQAVRFLGDKAYVVTYPEETFVSEVDFTPGVRPDPIIDPLYVVDLVDPKNPRVRGELKVEGYSTYLHAFGEGFLLAIGVDTTPDNIFRGLSLSIFDVRNPDAPTLAHRTRLGNERSASEAIANHHAFTFFERAGLLTIPHQQYESPPDRWSLDNSNLTSNGLDVFRVSAETGFTRLGSVDQMGLVENADVPVTRANGRCAAVRRGIIIGEGDTGFVYAVSDLGLSIARVEEDMPLVSTLSFGAEGCREMDF